jgi:sensor domain CHASE-containing protein
MDPLTIVIIALLSFALLVLLTAFALKSAILMPHHQEEDINLKEKKL